MDNSMLYGPCPCGSGNKFKFCCWPKCRDRIEDDMTKAEVVQTVRCAAAGVYNKSDKPGADALYQRGGDAFYVGDMEKARPLFRQARMIDPKMWAAWNNESVCLWEDGDVEHAYDIQRRGIEANSFRNNFGFASMAIYSHVLGRDDEAAGWLDKTFSDKSPISRDVVIQTCRVLALFQRHRDIVDYATGSGMDEDGLVAFYKGTALANLGDLENARKSLELASASNYGAMAEKYLDDIRQGVSPLAVCDGGWPYFWVDSFPPARLLETAIEEGCDPFALYPNVAADAIEVLVSDETYTPKEMLELIEGRPGERMEKLRAELKQLAEARVDEEVGGDGDAETAEPDHADGEGDSKVEEVEDENCLSGKPKWRMKYLPPEDGTPEDDAKTILDRLVRPYAEHYCDIPGNPEGGGFPIAFLRAIFHDEVSDLESPSVTLGRSSQLWDILRAKLEEFFRYFGGSEYECEVRFDNMCGGPILTLVDTDDRKIPEIFMVSAPDLFGNVDMPADGDDC